MGDIKSEDDFQQLRVSNTNGDGEDLELTTPSIEKQLELLTRQVQQLTVKLADEKAAKEIYKHQVQETLEALEDLKSDTLQSRSPHVRKELRPKYLVPIPNWIEPQHPEALCWREEVNQLRQQVFEERQKSTAMREHYEEEIKHIRLGYEKKYKNVHFLILQQVDHLIRRYRRLAHEAIERARSEQVRVLQQREKAKLLAEQACRNFEKDIKMRTKKALEEYRELARQAHKAALEERQTFKQKCEELQKTVTLDKQEFDSMTIRESEKRIRDYRIEMERMREQMETERRNFTALMNEVSQRVEVECRKYDEKMTTAIVKIFEDKKFSSGKENLKDDFYSKIKPVGLDVGHAPIHCANIVIRTQRG